jgi:uncharacterized protein (DUF58 family)
MTPTLARRGKLVLASAASFMVIGAIYSAAPLIALGGAVLSAMLAAYLWFFPTAILLRRRKIELSWWVPPGDQPGGALAVDRPFSVHIALRNHGARALRILGIDIQASAALEVPEGLEAVVAAGVQVEVAGEGLSRSAGYQVLHGAVLVFGDALGLFDVRAYFPNPIAIKVFPKQTGVRASGAMRPKGGALHERVGVHHVRRRGLAGELREIREHAHGDPFKFIAWKATARKRKLMVRDLETEIVVTHQILVDIAGTMRGGSPGLTKLDYAIETATALSKAALDGGDRVGMITHDSRIYSALKPGDGYHHHLKIVDRLLETHNIVDEDLTDLTNGELVATVARYLAHQEAVDVRLRRAPALDDPAWERIQAGPDGELYDIGVLGSIVATLLKSMGQSTSHKSMAPAWWWSRVQIGRDSDKQMSKLRLFCRLRGIELPYRSEHEYGRRAQGLAEAIARVTKSRADVIMLIGDLGGVVEDPDITAKALARAKRGGQQVIAIAPFGPAFAPPPGTAIGSAVADILERDERDKLEHARKLLIRHGIPVLSAGPDDGVGVLMGRIGRARSSMRRFA